MGANLATLEEKLDLKANRPQSQFLRMPHKFRAFVAGYGSGKTYVGGMAMCSHFREHPQINAGYFAPSYPMIRDIFYPTIEEVAYNFGFRVQINQSNKEVHFFIGRWYYGTSICRSMDDPGKIIGFKIGHALIDEFDTLPLMKALLVWKRVIARMRFKIGGLRNGIDVTTTPEGFLATHKLFVEDVIAKPELSNNYCLIQASTYENEINLPDDYIPSMIESYTLELALAYVDGQFVNLKSGTVYRNYNRVTNNSNEIINPRGEVLIIGMDFNVQKMAARIFVQRSNGFHCVAELKDIFDTPAMIRVIAEKWPKASNFRHIIYPDASGASRNTTGAATSDIKLLLAAGFEVRAHASNPFVKDRVNAVNVAFSKQKVWVNAKECPDTASCLEKQAYDDNGEPDKKGGFDHGNDAFGYPIAYEMPVLHIIRQATTHGT
ncbi:MAG: terminase large subunit [Nitrosomonas sp.]|uniref:terminase large subunit domain-containing protein n=1 Tax=Nitrosomonas sp. TaxID=42353 RepID=UPI0025DE63AB|nr:terminase family protein [Nitrosomonas sp.]MBY0473752.1 terminase large subunit [Nitrosomonas sp.]